MDLRETTRPVLHPLVEELLDDERLAAFADALPAPARVSEPALPLLLAALHEHLGRALVCVLPEDADARDAAEAARWFLGEERVALLPSRGVRWDSGLEPPPHLVGERARALDVLAAGGLVCASAAALAEGAAAAARRGPAPIALAAGDEPGLEALAEQLALAGYERVDRAEERGQFAVRGGLVDVFPTTGREPLRSRVLRRRDRGRARVLAVHAARAARGRRARSSTRPPSGGSTCSEPTLSRRRASPRRCPDDLVPPLDRAAGPRLGGRRGARGLGARSWHRARSLERQRRARPVPARAAVRVRGAAPGDRGARAGRGRERAGRLRPRRQPRRRRLPAPRRGAAHGEPAAPRRAELLERPATGSRDEPELCFAVSPARRGFVWRELGLVLLPDTQVFRKRARRAPTRGSAARCSRSPTCAPATTSSTRTTASASCSASRRRRSPSVTRDYLFLAFRGDDRLYVPHEQIGKVSRYIGADASAPALSKLGGKAWQNLKSRARASRARAGRRAARALRAAPAGARASPYELENEWLERLEAEFPYRETEDQARAIEAVKEDLEAPRPMDRLVCGDVGFGKTEVAVRAAFAVAVNGKQTLMLVPTTILAEQHWNTFRERYRDFPVRVEMVSRFRSAEGAEAGASRTSRRARSTS